MDDPTLEASTNGKEELGGRTYSGHETFHYLSVLWLYGKASNLKNHFLLRLIFFGGQFL